MKPKKISQENVFKTTDVSQGEMLNKEEDVLQAYAVSVAQHKYSEELIRQTIKELADIKCALDKAAIVGITDAKGIITYVNNTFCEISQYSQAELIGKDHRIVNSGYHSKEFFQQMWSTISRGKIWKGEIKNKAKDGSFYWVDTSIVPFLDEAGKPVQYLSIRFEITERKEAEEALKRSQEELREKAEQLEQAMNQLKHTQSQLVQAEKMSSLGQLVAGVAHEINNPINFIYGNLTHINEYAQSLFHILNLYQQYYPDPVPEIKAEIESQELHFVAEDLPKLLDSMTLGTNRILQVIVSLRNFSRVDEAQKKAVNLHEGIDSTLLILQNRLKARGKYPGVEVVKEYGKLPLVECYAGQLNQVFMNIISNAIDAVVSRFTNDTFLGKPRISICTEVVGKEWVRIAIADNGIGMTEEVRHKVFHPFFTTKPIGAGTGLGLSISYQIIVEKHGGNLTCVSAPKQGTKFIIEIPIQQSK
ncbi:ATP-binding protein [Aerosakkonemataceae cyanobacterium BLCC-F154]|uniref:histidine kinase n=1 Tax=Floridaenema fluviatile BLCC-F154 TaxID=3153640 RepID=A0ABV4YAR4_9CYAN